VEILPNSELTNLCLIWNQIKQEDKLEMKPIKNKNEKHVVVSTIWIR